MSIYNSDSISIHIFQNLQILLILSLVTKNLITDQQNANYFLTFAALSQTAGMVPG